MVGSHHGDGGPDGGDPACWAHRFDDGPELPAPVIERARASGAAGQRWLDDLPGVVDAMVQRWGLTLGAMREGGTASYVVDAVDRDGRAAVLKIPMALDEDDHTAFAHSVTAHESAAGRGCAELFAHDPVAPALLTERLGPNLASLGLPVDEVIETVTTTLRRFWRPVPDDADLPTGAHKAAWLARFIWATWDELDRPCERTVIDRAVALCAARARAYDAATAVLVHGDAHGWNVLTVDDGAGADGAHKLVDPEGLRSEPAHDLAVSMREYNAPLLAGDTPALVRARAELLASWCDVDPDAVWEWGYIERVSTGLAALRNLGGADGEGHAMLEVARRCL